MKKVRGSWLPDPNSIYYNMRFGAVFYFTFRSEDGTLCYSFQWKWTKEGIETIKKMIDAYQDKQSVEELCQCFGDCNFIVNRNGKKRISNLEMKKFGLIKDRKGWRGFVLKSANDE